MFCDSDWANDKSDAKSISGFVIILARGAICWRSRKQKCVASSTTHAEYMSMYEALVEYEWLIQFLQEIDV